MNARFWEEMGKQPPSAVIVDRAVRLHERGFDKLDETLSEADEAFEASVVREIMSKVDQAVEASSPEEPVFATCAKVYNDWEVTRSLTFNNFRRRSCGLRCDLEIVRCSVRGAPALLRSARCH